MGSIKKVVIAYLHLILLIYLIAFLSLFIQIPGLYGDDGILSVKRILNYDENSKHNQPTLLRNLPLNWSLEFGMDFLCFTGIILSMVSLLIPSMINCFTFFLLWLLYMSCFQVGQVFLWFQWDTLLLELGFLTIIVAPLNLNFLPIRFLQFLSSYTEHQSISFWLVRWLTFRLMFCSGVVKLLSGCPTWWGLTALTYHYESQCIPTQLAWIAHHQPVWLHRLSNAMVFVIQIGSSILFYSPFRLHRIASFFLQSMLMVLIMLTGNYNFFNIASIIICLSLVDDKFIDSFSCCNDDKDKKPTGQRIVIVDFLKIVKFLVHFFVIYILIWGMIKYFNVKFDFANLKIDCEIGFTMSDFQSFLQKYVPITIYITGISLLTQICYCLFRSVIYEVGKLRKFFSCLACLIHAFIAILIFSTTLVPYTGIELNSQNALPQKFKIWHHQTQHLNIFNAYGLFRSMTGVGGRPEVIVEGSNEIDRGWEELNFLYKPGDVNRAPPFVAPHQPRLDWQIWFAALSSYQHHSWFISLVYKLLQNKQPVKDLMDVGPFFDEPPKYIRAHLYHYHYTDFNDTNINAWWRREYIREYLPIVSLNDNNFIEYLSRLNLIDADTNVKAKYDVFTSSMHFLHKLLPPNHGFLICIFIPLTTVAIKFRHLIGQFLAGIFSKSVDVKKNSNGMHKIKIK